MPIVLPDFKNSHCVALTACADITSADRKLLKWLKSEKTAVCRFSTPNGKTYLRVAFGGNSGRHVHIDIAKPSVFPPVKDGHSKTLNQIQKKFEHINGEEVQVRLRGMFQINYNELPDAGIIKSLSFQSQTGSVGLKMKGAKFSITGAPVKSLSWQTLPDEKRIGVILETHFIKTNIADDYLQTALNIVENPLNVFVLGKAVK